MKLNMTEILILYYFNILYYIISRKDFFLWQKKLFFSQETLEYFLLFVNVKAYWYSCLWQHQKSRLKVKFSKMLSLQNISHYEKCMKI